MRLEVLCSKDTEPEVRRITEVNLRKNLLKAGISPALMEYSQISVAACEGKTQNIITVWNLPVEQHQMVMDTVYASFGEHVENRLIDGLTNQLIGTRKHLASAH